MRRSRRAGASSRIRVHPRPYNYNHHVDRHEGRSRGRVV